MADEKLVPIIERWRMDEAAFYSPAELTDPKPNPQGGYSKDAGHRGRKGGPRGGSVSGDAKTGEKTHGKTAVSAAHDITAMLYPNMMLTKTQIRAITDAILDCYEFGMREKREQAVFVDWSGTVAGKAGGGEQHVATKATAAIMNSPVGVHNHPITTAFSNGDVRTFFQIRGQRYMFVVDNEGTIYFMSKPLDWELPDFGKWSRRWESIMSDEAGKLHPGRDFGWIVMNHGQDMPFIAQVTHNTNARFANEFGLRYQRFVKGVDYGR